LSHADIFIPLCIGKDWYKGSNSQSQSKFTHFSHLQISGNYTWWTLCNVRCSLFIDCSVIQNVVTYSSLTVNLHKL
jgi:hypothetical protein